MTEETKESQVFFQSRADKHGSEVWQVLWFFVHLTAVYLIVQFVTPWLAGWTHGTLLPILQLRSPSGRFQFFSLICSRSASFQLCCRPHQRQIQAQGRGVCVACSGDDFGL